jgi:cytochrome c peroxidase
MIMVCIAGIALAQAPDPNAPPSLKGIIPPEPPDLEAFVLNRSAAIRLGKALFWDMQVGSDGVTACATCHFHAGADSRIKNQFSSGLLHRISGSPHIASTTFSLGGPNATLQPSHFPFHRRAVPVDSQASAVLFDTDDVASSQGVFNTQFVDIVPGSAEDLCNDVPDPVFNVGGINTRRVEPRNTPTVINAVFNVTNFWDGRANRFFNGVNPFGPSDVNARILINDPVSGLRTAKVAIDQSSLASQAVGPPGSDFEMSCANRPFPKIGKKMISLTPLGKQLVHPNDSVLGPLSSALLDSQGRAVGIPGLTTNYADMIRAAFLPRYWNSDRIITFPNGVMTIGNPGAPVGTNEFTQMEANFSLFFGLAIQMYEATLISDDTPFDRFQIGDATAMTLEQRNGLNTFLSGGTRCSACHEGTLFSGAAPVPLPGVPPVLIVEAFPIAQGLANYDEGFYNLGVTRNTANLLPNGDTATIETYDIGRGGTDPFGNPLSFSRLALLKLQGLLDPEYSPFVPDLTLCTIFPCPVNRVTVDGRFKAPQLRNVELTGPFFHNGGERTLLDVINFYARGGNFPVDNILNLDPEIGEIGGLQANQVGKDEMVAFLRSLTDPRVRNEGAPFDHPQLLVPNGHPGNNASLTCTDGIKACDDLLEVVAVGASGRAAIGLPPLQGFGDSEPNLTVILAGNGAGTVTSAPAGINCGLSCTESFNLGTVVTLTAAQAAGSSFTSWAGCTPDAVNPKVCTVTMNTATNVTATFSVPNISVTPLAHDFGSINVGSVAIKTFTVNNAIPVDLVVGSASVGSSPTGDFTKGLDTCSGQTIPPGGSCTIQVRFLTITTTGSTGSLTIPSNDPDPAPIIGVIGFGTNNQVFGDVQPTSPFENHVNSLFNNAITSGCAPGQFCPAGIVTRGEMSAFIIRALEGNPAGVCSAPPFTDVPVINQFCKHIERMKARNISLGFPDGTYQPQSNVTREQMAAFIIRALEGDPAGTCAEPPFTDVPVTSPFCKHIERMKALNISLGFSDGTYQPPGNVTRDQMAAFIARAFLGLP